MIRKQRNQQTRSDNKKGRLDYNSFFDPPFMQTHVQKDKNKAFFDSLSDDEISDGLLTSGSAIKTGSGSTQMQQVQGNLTSTASISQVQGSSVTVGIPMTSSQTLDQQTIESKNEHLETLKKLVIDTQAEYDALSLKERMDGKGTILRSKMDYYNDLIAKPWKVRKLLILST